MKTDKEKIIEEVLKKMREKYNLNVVRINLDLNKKKGKLVRMPEKEILSFNEILQKTIELTIQKRDEKVLKLIDEDIAYEKKKLTGNFEKDKIFQWRIEGMTYLKSIIIK